MTVQSDRHTKLVFLVFLLTVFDFGFFQEPPQPIDRMVVIDWAGKGRDRENTSGQKELYYKRRVIKERIY